MLLICEFISFPALTGITSVCDDLSEYMRGDKAFSVWDVNWQYVPYTHQSRLTEAILLCA